MIEPKQMQEPVHDEMLQMLEGFDALILRFSQDGFDGEHDIPTVEGPILKELESHADYPPDVAAWYETMAREVMRALDAADARDRVASDDALWSGPRPGGA